MVDALNFSETDYEPVEFKSYVYERILVKPMYFDLGFSPKSAIYGRKAVLTRLLKALEIIPPELGFLIWDVYRPRLVQRRLFNWMRDEIRKNVPHLSEEENYAETRKFASLPSVPGEAYCPPHLSGGAIDLTLFDLASGNPVEMGTLFDECTEVAHRDYYAHKTQLTTREKVIQEHRRILCSALEQVGFTSYSYEWWHFDLGNVFWSQIVHRPEVFGPLFGDEEWPLE